MRHQFYCLECVAVDFFTNESCPMKSFTGLCFWTEIKCLLTLWRCQLWATCSQEVVMLTILFNWNWCGLEMNPFLLRCCWWLQFYLKDCSPQSWLQCVRPGLDHKLSAIETVTWIKISGGWIRKTFKYTFSPVLTRDCYSSLLTWGQRPTQLTYRQSNLIHQPIHCSSFLHSSRKLYVFCS